MHTPKKPQPRDARDLEKLIRIAGVPAVAAVFDRNPERVERLFYDAATRPLVGGWCRRLARDRKPYRMVPADELARVAGTVLHGGIVAVVRPRPVSAFDAAAALHWARGGQPLLLLDGIGNPHNLGAIVRTAAFFGLDRLVISDHPAQAGPSEAAHRVAEGGLEHVELVRAERFGEALRRLRAGYRVVGTALGRGRPLTELPRDRPVAMVLGNEETGLGRETLDACEDIVTLRGSGRVQSLSVAATAAILIHMLTGQ
jgi:TrmH RNA methyltransferase